jgi:hypothetical protein
MLTLTDRAREALAAADTAARRWNPDARVRIRRAGSGIVSDLTDAPGPGESLVDLDGLTLVVEDALAGTIDAGEHNVLTILPA